MDQKKIGLFLKALRSEKAVTQAELAERLGVSNRSVSRWENGTTMPDFDLILELAKYYDVEVSEILNGKRSEDQELKKEELMLTIADYHNAERDSFAKRMHFLFLLALISMAVYTGIDLLGLAEVAPYENGGSLALGFVTGALITGFLYTGRTSAKLKETKIRLLRRIQGLK